MRIEPMDSCLAANLLEKAPLASLAVRGFRNQITGGLAAVSVGLPVLFRYRT
jgi:hypothetical protein